MLQLLQTRKCPKLIAFGAKLYPLEKLSKLACAVTGGVTALEARELVMDTREAHSVATVVLAWWTRAHFAAREFGGDYVRDFADAVVLGILADVEDFASYCVRRRAKRAVDRFADVEYMD